MAMDAEEYKVWLNDLLLHGTAITRDGKRVAREDWFFSEPPNYVWGGGNLKVPNNAPHPKSKE